MLRELHLQKLHTQEDCKNYIGKIFRTRFLECPPWFTDVEVADTILKRCVLIHLDDAVDKFNLLVFMTQKLYCFVQDRCAAEKSDAVMMQEVLMGKCTASSNFTTFRLGLCYIYSVWSSLPLCVYLFVTSLDVFARCLNSIRDKFVARY